MQKPYPIYDQNGWKTIPLGAAHTYNDHIREFPSPAHPLKCTWDMHDISTVIKCQMEMTNENLVLELTLWDWSGQTTYFQYGQKPWQHNQECHIYFLATMHWVWTSPSFYLCNSHYKFLGLPHQSFRFCHSPHTEHQTWMVENCVKVPMSDRDPQFEIPCRSKLWYLFPLPCQ